MAYCIDEACAYIADNMERRVPFRAPRRAHEARDGSWSTNADVIAELRRESKMI